MLRALQEGWQLLGSHKKAVVYFYLANLLVAALLLYPFMTIFDESLGGGLYREKLVAGIDYDWYMLFRDRVKGFAATFSPAVLGLGPFARNLEALLDGELTGFSPAVSGLGVIYLLMNCFLLGATLGSFVLDPQGTSLREFFRNGGMLFGRFFRLTLLSILLYGLLWNWVAGPLNDLVEHVSLRVSTDSAAFYWSFLRYLILLLLFLFMNMLFDYAKIKTALEDRTSVILACFSSLRFCLGNFPAAYLFYLLVVSLGVAWAMLYAGLEYLLPQQNWFAIVIAFSLQQVFIIGRLALKLLFYSAQMRFYLGRTHV